jgi:hypothetical protein
MSQYEPYLDAGPAAARLPAVSSLPGWQEGAITSALNVMVEGL